MGKAPTLNEILNKKNEDLGTNIIRIRHAFMRKYGWISDEEFRNMKIPVFLGLLLELNREAREEEEAYRSMRR